MQTKGLLELGKQGGKVKHYTLIKVGSSSSSSGLRNIAFIFTRLFPRSTAQSCHLQAPMDPRQDLLSRTQRQLPLHSVPAYASSSALGPPKQSPASHRTRGYKITWHITSTPKQKGLPSIPCSSRIVMMFTRRLGLITKTLTEASTFQLARNHQPYV